MHNKVYNLQKIATAMIVLVGVVFLAGTFFFTSKQDYDDAQQDMLRTLQYVKSQYMEYKKTDTASEAKSMAKANDKVHQAVMRMEQDGKPLTPELLHDYAVDLRITGIIVLDEQGNPVCESAEDKFSFASLKNELLNPVMLSLAKQQKKVYAKRIHLYDGTFLDMGAHERVDKPGIVICYLHTPLNYIRNYNMSMETLLAGYNMNAVGTIVISDGYKVLSSNDPMIMRHHLRKNELVEQLRQSGHKGELTLLKNAAGEEFYGTLDRGRDFYVYMYLPKSKVFATRWQKLGYAAIVYLVIVCLFLLWRRRSEKAYLEKQHELDEVYKKQLLEAAQTAERANNAKTEFLQRMSHDVRTPINGIRGMLEIARQNEHNPEKLAECHKKIEEASGYLLDLVNEVLDMGKLDAGKVVLEHVPFSLNKICSEVLALIKKQAQENDIEITSKNKNVHNDAFIGSPVHVKRVLINILNNAVKYNKPHGQIFLSIMEMKREGNIAWVSFRCKDTGFGISEDFLPHIFEPFSQATESARSSYEGTGLGMPIVKSLVEKMGGTVKVESKKGFGSTFYVCLPLEIDTDPIALEQPAESFDPQKVRGMYVLVAEDNALNLEIAQFFLENAGINYIAVNNGKKALEAFAASAVGEFDAILMDIMMPEMDGLEATRKIRALERGDARSVPIIAMTANAFDDDRQKAFAAGMTEHITKPLQAKVLLKALATHVKRHEC